MGGGRGTSSCKRDVGSSLLQGSMFKGLGTVTLKHMLFFRPFFALFKKQSICFGERKEWCNCDSSPYKQTGTGSVPVRGSTNAGIGTGTSAGYQLQEGLQELDKITVPRNWMAAHYELQDLWWQDVMKVWKLRQMCNLWMLVPAKKMCLSNDAVRRSWDL